MEVTFEVNRHLTKYFEKVGIVTVELKEQATINDLLKVIKDQCGVPIVDKINTDVELRRYFIITQGKKFAGINDIIDGTKIKIIPPISGG